MVWIPKFRQNDLTLRYIEENISLFDTGTTSLSGSNIILFDNNVYALLYQIKNFQNTLLPEEKQYVIRQAIKEIRATSHLSIENFQSALQIQVDAICNQSYKRFFLVIPSKIKFDPQIDTEIPVLNTKIKIVNSNYLKENYNLNEKVLTDFNFQLKEISDLLNSNECFFLIEQWGRYDEQASKEAYKQFELFRSILNFVADYQTYDLFQFGIPKASSFIYPSKFALVFDNEKNLIQHLIVTLQLEDKPIKTPSDIKKICKYISEAKKILQKLEKIEDLELRNLLISSFELHCDALDFESHSWLSCFHLWQILESISLYNHSITYDQVCKRIVSLLGHFHPWNDIIQLFLQKRNNFVHRGNKSEFTRSDINAIKGLVQFSMIRLLQLSDEFKDLEGLNFFYEGIDYYHKSIGILDYSCKDKVIKKRKMLKLVQEMKIFNDSNNMVYEETTRAVIDIIISKFVH